MQPFIFLRTSSFCFFFLAIILAMMMQQEMAGASSPDPQEGTVPSLDGVPLHYSSYGAGSPALVFVHGISCDQSYWREQVSPFSMDFRVVTIDLAGHGESGLGRKEWSMDAYGGDVSSVIEALDLQSVVLIGHSMGGAVILEAARRLQDRVKGLVVVDSYDDLGTWWTTEEIEETLAPFQEDFVEETRSWVRSMFVEDSDPTFVEQIVTNMSAAPPEVALPSLESALEVMVGRERTTALRGLDMPVVFINADYGPTDVESLEQRGVEVRIIPGTGHFFMLERPNDFNVVLSNVIESIVN